MIALGFGAIVISTRPAQAAAAAHHRPAHGVGPGHHVSRARPPRSSRSRSSNPSRTASRPSTASPASPPPPPRATAVIMAPFDYGNDTEQAGRRRPAGRQPGLRAGCRRRPTRRSWPVPRTTSGRRPRRHLHRHGPAGPRRRRSTAPWSRPEATSTASARSWSWRPATSSVTVTPDPTKLAARVSPRSPRPRPSRPAVTPCRRVLRRGRRQAAPCRSARRLTPVDEIENLRCRRPGGRRCGSATSPASSSAGRADLTRPGPTGSPASASR